MHSMTGFGQGVAEGERFRVSVTLRAVNHRYLDLVLRLKDEVRGTEHDLRRRLQEGLQRGRVEAIFETENIGAPDARIHIDRGLVSALRRSVGELANEGVLAEEVTLADLLKLPDAVRVEADIQPWSEHDLELIFRATDEALAQLVEARRREGEALSSAIMERIAGLRELHGEMSVLAQALPKQMAESLKERVQQLLEDGTMPDETRLAQEVALWVDRTDVSEELDRLVSHLDHFEQIAGRQGSIGKRLDFLSQEIFRELNTIGSKCRDAPLVRHVLDAKVLVEQIREQTQNVE